MLKVLKFGGTSVGSAAALRRAAGVVASEAAPGSGLLVVVSALSGITDLLLGSIALASRGDVQGALDGHARLEARHRELRAELGLEGDPDLQEAWETLFQHLRGLLQGMGLLREASARSVDAALAVGETLSAHLMAAHLRAQGLPSAFRDVREVLPTDARHGKARPRLEALPGACAPWRRELEGGALLVTQGFLGSAPEGATTTLGRSGSDTSAALLAEALGAEEVQIWTDVDGVLSADPSLVPQARPIPRMSLREAAALSAFGAKVLHAGCLAPVARGGLRMVVANTHRPQASRTVIQAEPPERRPGEVTSVAYKEGLSCLRFAPGAEGEALPEAARRLQAAGAALYALLANPEGGLMVLRPEGAACAALLEDLRREGVEVQGGWAVVALVGEGLGLDPRGALGLLAGLEGEPVAGLLAGNPGVSLSFLVPDRRLQWLIPRLHSLCGPSLSDIPSPSTQGDPHALPSLR